MKQAVLLLAHGAPERQDDVDEYMQLVRGGRSTSPELIAEVKRRYAEIGGGSPMLARTREQARSLENRLAELGFPVKVYFGMRNWHPLIKETMGEILADEVERIVAICLAPQYSKLSVGLYFRRTQEAKQNLGVDATIVWTKSFHDHPLLIDAFKERLAPVRDRSKVLFTAHSLPERILENADPYDSEAKGTAALVAAASGIRDWDFAYQSQGMTDEKWLGPTVESRLDEYAAEGVEKLTLAPIGFVSDHLEILYDVDILFKTYAGERGIRLVRPESLNDSPTFISALADVAAEKLQPPA